MHLNKLKRQPLSSPKTSGPTVKPVCDIDVISETRTVSINSLKSLVQIIIWVLLFQSNISKNLFWCFWRNVILVYNGGLSSLGKVLHKICFKFIKDNPHRELMELLNGIVSSQLCEKYKLGCLRRFVYLDEMWIFQHGIEQRSLAR